MTQNAPRIDVGPAPSTEWRERRMDAHRKQQQPSVEELQRLVHNYNETQGMACTGFRMDPYTPCNGDFGRLCMQCPRKKGLAITHTQLPG